MPNDFETAKTAFMNLWLMDVTKTFRDAVIAVPELEKHFNDLSAGELAEEMLRGLVDDMEGYDFCLDATNLYDVEVESVIDESGVELRVSFPFTKRLMN
jgi:hypothetical protein